MASINGKSMDNNVRYTLVNMGANRWLAIRLETLGGIMIRFTATFAVMQNGRADNQQAFASTMGLLLKLERGRILIDDCDIAKFGLMDLRKVLGIIPQSPVLFSGFGEGSFEDVIRRNSLGLDSEV
ncbi:ABC transporter C family member 2-like [Populus alba]|uniref:ABC transporter C family member 2-like n=1 Tax=Populus alba TaxID=43335 RepID=UPI003CC6EBDB